MASITSNLNMPTSRQVPDHSIMDLNGKQTYLGNQFAVVLPSTSISGTSEQGLLLIANPTTVSSANNLKSLFISLKALLMLTASQTATLRFYVSPNAATGTPYTPLNLRPASSNTSVAAASTSPTVTSNGTLIDLLGATTGFPTTSKELLILDPGQSLLATIQCSASSSISAQVLWYEL